MRLLGVLACVFSPPLVLVACSSRSPRPVAPIVVGSAPKPSVSEVVSVSMSASSADSSASVVASTSASASVSASADPKITIGPGTRVLVFGDSMVQAGLATRLKKLVEARGGKLFENAWTSSTTTKWAEADRLSKTLAGVRPDVVFLTIGANEVYWIRKGTDAAIRKIVKTLAGRPCVWVGPPVWKHETGIVGLERENSGPCLFFDSGKLKLPRQPDGIHPNMDGGRIWAEAVWAASVASVVPSTMPSGSSSASSSASATPRGGT